MKKLDIHSVRVGNLLYSKLNEISIKHTRDHKTVITADAKTLEHIQYNLSPEDKYSGIPITEDILKRSGFKPGPAKPLWFSKDLHDEGNFEFYIYYHLDSKKCGIAANCYLDHEEHEGDFPLEVEFFHELQNIIYDLTKQELKF